MSTLVSKATHASRVKFIAVVFQCGHTSSIKVAPAISAQFVRQIRREAKQRLCSSCRKVAAVKARRAK
jgi:hypothetical protein